MEKKALDPNDFPVVADGKALVTQDGTAIAIAQTESIADDIANRLNENASRKREDRWAL
jgi:hypothetical protein